MARTANLFLSHTWSYADQYGEFCRLLDQAVGFSYTSHSVAPGDPVHQAGSPARLHAAIKDQMEPCRVMVIMAGMCATSSKRVDAELRTAGDQFAEHKPVLAVRPWQHARVSPAVEPCATRPVDWDADAIASAILGVAASAGQAPRCRITC
jgi:hypothetical protein